MAPINGKPFLHYIFKELQHQKIKNVVLSVGHLNEIIQDFFGENYLGITIKYAIETEPLGTGGGIKHAFNFVEYDAFIINGDTFFDIDLSKIKNEKNDLSADRHDITIALKPMFDFDRYGTVEINNENRIVAFNEKRHCEKGLINGGVYYFKKSLFDKIKTETKFSFEKDILESHTNDLQIQGKIFDNYFIDIGIPEDYNRAQIDFR